MTVADLVFPWFMWIMGVSLVFSMQNQLRNSVPRSQLVKNIIRRSLILFFLGLVVNSIGGHNNFRTMRIPGRVLKALKIFRISKYVIYMIM